MAGVALITGASSGLGRGLALRLARDGWKVGAAARRKEALDALVRRIESGGGRAVALPCDVSERERVREEAARCRDALGPVELLVANAGVSRNTAPGSLNAGEVEWIHRVNFLGTVYAVEAVLPEMLARDRGQIVGVSSLAGMGGLPLTAAYSASKAAQTNFLESLRIDLRDRGVDVTVITPGYVRTPMTEGSDHPTPFLVELDDAVERMASAIRDRRRHLAFPWPLAALTWAARVFPRSLYDWMASRFDRRKRRDGAGGP